MKLLNKLFAGVVTTGVGHNYWLFLVPPLPHFESQKIVKKCAHILITILRINYVQHLRLFLAPFLIQEGVRGTQ